MIHTFTYAIKEEVRIPAINQTGRVEVVAFDGKTESYKVIYWIKEERQAVWLYEYELAKNS